MKFKKEFIVEKGKKIEQKISNLWPKKKKDVNFLTNVKLNKNYVFNNIIKNKYFKDDNNYFKDDNGNFNVNGNFILLIYIYKRPYKKALIIMVILMMIILILNIEKFIKN